MSLTTRCPACETVFKIVPDQLKISSGWVRCGRCAEVFDAASHAASPNTEQNWPLRNPEQTTPPNQAASTTPISVHTENVSIESDASQKPSSNANQTDTTDLTFVRMANSKAFWQRTSVVRSLRTACIGLVCLLFFQIVYSQRSHLAASSSGLNASLESFCQKVGCRIQAFKNIDAFKIDSSSFQKSQPAATDLSQTGIFALKLAIKNTSDLTLALPSVELTLTEATDKPVVRRVLSPKDLGYNNVTLAANTEWNGAMNIAVSPNNAAAPITGYRVLLFYP
jgi:predicted Zn finger-like uncharacterized protein